MNTPRDGGKFCTLGTVKHPSWQLACFIWALGGCLYLIGFFHRVAPAAISSDLMRDLGIGAAMLGNLSALYFYSYAFMQLPTGLLADRWGPRRLLTIGALLTAVGSVLFALAPTLWLAGLGRLLIGGATAVAFVGMIKLASHWMAPERFALAAGMALLIGVMGALGGGIPLAALSEVYDWRWLLAAVGGATLLLAAIIWFIVRDDPAERGYRSYASRRAGEPISLIAGLKVVAAARNSWLLSVGAGGVCGAVLTFGGLWGVPFLATHYGMSTTAASGYCSAMLLSFAVGGPLLGGLSDRLGRRKPFYFAALSSSLPAWLALILLPELPPLILLLCVVAAGFGCGGAMIITFAHARESVPSQVSGTMSGLINMGAVLGPMILQPAIGWILDNISGVWSVGGQRMYDLEAYRVGFSLIVGWIVLALILFALSHETYGKQSQCSNRL
ncbi:MFS family permease [Natronocella acetinitrilica]|uniref:Lysosomal dipeptide transporter MFSD1 n=1 Tax=Natronocella acetinitrilica TaxID=414046 RepID=A0AAE3G9Z2_9GAMM|nr:MFS transporter [Natronocella acetinitrilica]MCP1677248.1 MFS family permease [Natronocella acetinitrilica]